MTNYRMLNLLLLAFGLIATLAIAASPSPTRTVPVSTVIKSDGSLVRGQITTVDPDQLTVQPAPTAKDPTPAAVSVPWSDIKSVSSGLTRAKAIQQWKLEHHDSLCATCLGDRTVPCPTCHGTNHDPASRKDCPTCHGELLVDCKTPREKEGKIPCPNHCLQLTEGQWVKKEDGSKWRYFKFHNGAWASYSEHHLGHVIVVDMKAQTATDTGTCPACNGATIVPDPTCQGTGKVPCPTCTADKVSPACPAHCVLGRQTCSTCAGTGLKKA